MCPNCSQNHSIGGLCGPSTATPGAQNLGYCGCVCHQPKHCNCHCCHCNGQNNFPPPMWNGSGGTFTGPQGLQTN